MLGLNALLKVLFLPTGFQTVSRVVASPSAQTPLQWSLHDTPAFLSPVVDAAIDKILADFRTPGGIGVAIVHKPDSDEASEWHVETKGYGLARLDGTKATADTLWPIGSNSKLFDILATGLVISNTSLEQRVDWETKVGDIVPEWGLMDPVAERETTIVDLMSHRTGLPRHDLILSPENTTEAIKRLRYLRPSTTFRDRWQYNNHMYTVLSQIPTQLIGVPFETYVDENIFKPLGMNATTYFSTVAEDSGNLADGLGRDGANASADVFDVGTPRAYPFWLPNDKTDHPISGAGGVISSANDIAIWLQMLIGEGQHPVTKESVIPAEHIQRVASGVTVSVPVASYPELSPIVYGGAQSRGTYRGFEYIEHGGSVEGFKSQITRLPSKGFGVAVLSNDDSLGFEIAETVKFRLIDEFLGLEPIDWVARYRAAREVTLKNTPKPIPRSDDATPPLAPFEQLVGRYHNPGYGSIELCFVGTDPKGATPACRQLVSEIPTTLPGVIDEDMPTLLSRWEMLGLSHVALTHFDGDVFNVTGLNSKPTGDASTPYWVSIQAAPGILLAEFSRAGDAEDNGGIGIGMRGIWGAGDGVPSPRGESVKERAEIWFERV
ncbi:Beta-lactamase class penicillin binding protein [Mycena chlorophos]|uniref:Beta-lactamase class penicillin binding protein n=1 Tax=Mycena chlorophos TaxID=658473 RepID=A0A8H6SUD4_MYCCL|nr:Beta-lactamase class penicillin binding protein [Mycena chlorophos]